jgi:hypothetical protein
MLQSHPTAWLAGLWDVIRSVLSPTAGRHVSAQQPHRHLPSSARALLRAPPKENLLRPPGGSSTGGRLIGCFVQQGQGGGGGGGQMS